MNVKTVSSIVKELIETRPFLLEAMIRGILSFNNLAEELRGEIEQQAGKQVTQSSIVMALRRYAEEIKTLRQSLTSRTMNYEISMKTHIFDINLVKDEQLLGLLHHVYGMVSIQRGDFLNISVGSNEVSIAVSQKYRLNLLDLFREAEVIHAKEDLVAVTVLFTGDFIHTPGVVYEAVRRLAWENINMYEIISTTSELTFVVDMEHSLKAFESLQSFL